MATKPDPFRNRLFFYSKSSPKPLPGKGVNEALDPELEGPLARALKPYKEWRKMLSNFWNCKTAFRVAWPKAWHVPDRLQGLRFQSAEAAYHAAKYLFAGYHEKSIQLAKYAAIFSVNGKYEGLSVGHDPCACLLAGKARTKAGKRAVPLGPDSSQKTWQRPKSLDISKATFKAFIEKGMKPAWYAIFFAKFQQDKDCFDVLMSTSGARLCHKAPRRGGNTVDACKSERHIWDVLEDVRARILKARIQQIDKKHGISPTSLVMPSLRKPIVTKQTPPHKKSTTQQLRLQRTEKYC